MNEIIVPFTCSDFSVADLCAVAARIKARMARTITDIIETGRDLLEVKSKLEHGQFESWLSSEFSMTTRTAQKYMRAAAMLGDKSELSSYLTPNAVYLLSAPSTPKSVQKKVIDAVKSGEIAKPDDIRDLIHEVKDQERQEKTVEQRKKDREPKLSAPCEVIETARRMKSRPARWSDAASRAMTALEELQEMQSEFEDWKEGLPENLRESAVAEKLESITEIDFDGAIETVSAAEDADLPLGFGRD